MESRPVEIVAHRGLQGVAPENSAAAVQAAVDAGLTAIEVDVRRAREGTLVSLHDPRVDRTTDGKGPLRELSSAVVRRLRLRDGSPLPRIEEIVDLCRGRARLCIDVKEREIGQAVVDLVVGNHIDAEIWSTHAEVVARASDAGIPAALISHGLLPRGGARELAYFAAQLGAVAVSFFPADIELATVRAFRDEGMALMCGTPNDPPTWLRLARLHARAIITDEPVRCAEVLNSG